MAVKDSCELRATSCEFENGKIFYIALRAELYNKAWHIGLMYKYGQPDSLTACKPLQRYNANAAFQNFWRHSANLQPQAASL